MCISAHFQHLIVLIRVDRPSESIGLAKYLKGSSSALRKVYRDETLICILKLVQAMTGGALCEACDTLVL